MDEATAKMHRRLAADFFNRVWDLMELNERTAEETDEMIHAAHASRCHWGIVGEPVNWSRGEWQVSRMYAALGRAEAALFHARRGLEIVEAHGIGDWDLGFAYESLARAYALAGDEHEAREWLAKAREVAQSVAGDEDRKLLLSDLDTIRL